MFKCDNPNIITSDEGFLVQVLGQTGLKYQEGERSAHVSSEVLASPYGLVIYQSSIRRWETGGDINESQRSQIIDNIRRAFAFRNVEIEVI